MFQLMLISLIIKGIIIGTVVSAPMGPVGVVCVQRTINRGRWYGFVTGVGAACSDVFYAAITGYGMSLVGDFITNPTTQRWLQGLGSVLLLIFGIYTFFSKGTKQPNVSHKKGTLWHNFWTGFIVTLSNPLIILLYIALFAQFSFVFPDNTFHMLCGFLSICCGALLWWFMLTSGIDKVRNRFNLRGIKILNRTIGVIVIIASLVGFILTIAGSSIMPH